MSFVEVLSVFFFLLQAVHLLICQAELSFKWFMQSVHHAVTVHVTLKEHFSNCMVIGFIHPTTVSIDSFGSLSVCFTVIVITALMFILMHYILKNVFFFPVSINVTVLLVDVSLHLTHKKTKTY